VSDNLIRIDGTDIEVPVRIGNTLRDVLKDQTINTTFGGKDGKLSTAQAGLAASVVVKMQDKLIEHMQDSHQRELRLIAGFWKLYKTPIFQNAHSGLSEKTSNSAQNAPALKSVFTWGNVLGGGAVLMVAAGLLVTNLTKNYKDKAEAYEKDLKALAEENRKLEGDHQKEKTRAESAERALAAVQGVSAEVQQKLSTVIESLSNEKGEAARATAAGAEKTYQKLYESEKREMQDLQKKYDHLQKRYETLLERSSRLAGVSTNAHK